MQLPLRLLTPGEQVVLISHINPDGDAVGSLLALALVLKNLGWKEVIPVLSDGVPSSFNYLPLSKAVIREVPLHADYCILLDANETSRSGQHDALQQYLATDRLIVIDHHPPTQLINRAVDHLHQVDISSTCEILYTAFRASKIKITAEIATCLLTGIFTDTGGYHHSNTRNETLEACGFLMRCGGRLDQVVSNLVQGKTLSSLRLLGIALERVTITSKGRCAVTALTQADIEGTQATAADISGIVGHLAMLPGVKCALLISEFTPGIVRGSLRTTEGSTADVERLAKLLGGGGHKKAAGFSVYGHIEVRGQTWKVVA